MSKQRSVRDIAPAPRRKNEKDSRITASSFSWKQFLLIFAAILFTCGNYHIIYISYLGNNPDKQNTFPLAMLGVLLLVSFVGTFLIGLFKRTYFDRPIRTVADAAKRVTEGDFSVIVPPHRKDGKKDEMEVLIEDFNTMARELATIETLKTDFIANVSHEIKSPLAVMQNYATTLQYPNLSATERMDYAKTVADAAKSLSILVTNILKLNKLENQMIFATGEPYDLGEQIRECAIIFEDLWTNKNITFCADIDDELKVSYDRGLLDLVWNNLMSNAVKFTESGGSISVKLKAEQDFYVVTVSDTGCGMSKETIARIFDKFYQDDTSHGAEGNGLGMAIVKKVIDIVGGKITIQSVLGEGTTFTVKLQK